MFYDGIYVRIQPMSATSFDELEPFELHDLAESHAEPPPPPPRKPVHGASLAASAMRRTNRRRLREIRGVIRTLKRGGVREVRLLF